MAQPIAAAGLAWTVSAHGIGTASRGTHGRVHAYWCHRRVSANRGRATAIAHTVAGTAVAANRASSALATVGTAAVPFAHRVDERVLKRLHFARLLLEFGLELRVLVWLGLGLVRE